MCPPHWEASAKPAKKYSRNSAAWVGEALRHTCAYTEAKKKSGTNASIAKNSTSASARNAGSRNTRSLISGWRTPRSYRQNSTSSAAPPAMHPQVAALPQPQVAACWKPSTLRPIPATISRAPRTSRDSARGRSSSRARNVSTSATTATGTLTQKMARQVHEVSQPPSTGPSTVSAPDSPKNSASARPRRSTGNTATTTASAAGNSRAAPTPWVTRKAISQLCATPPVGTHPHSTDDTTNSRVPTTSTRRAPSRSASRPPIAKNAASASR